MEAIVGERQNLIDVALTYYGSKWPDGIFDMLQSNDELNLNDDLEACQVLSTPNVDENDFVLRTYRETNYRVSTKDVIQYQLVPEGDYQLTPEGQRIEFI